MPRTNQVTARYAQLFIIVTLKCFSNLKHIVTFVNNEMLLDSGYVTQSVYTSIRTLTVTHVLLTNHFKVIFLI